ncbi:MAG: hypothetical protein sL5_06580 [Candidatus Mesenet longicola]|uniref:Uncharacterized protein n=1 Tax=Candidatus Mesenet longicola TaxID=1892558 RepID=A0A8J3HVH2_9RICK|nr:MAG: hypothetical protein sGL2_06640 [Candidatus Mesenet longicola]GHM59665.1 MAG: hypothetical protein sL5_06580 [Candidatus Mesenet longicola]
MTTNLIDNNTNYNRIEQIQTDIANIKIKKAIGKLDKGNINTEGISILIENQLLGIKNILKQPKHSESYKNIRSLFENEKKLGALQVLFEFELNQAMNIQKTYEGITPQEALNIIYDVVPEVIVNGDGKVDASATSEAIGKQHENLDPLKKELNDLMDIYAESVKQKPIIQELMSLLFDEIIKMLKNRELKKTYKEELRKKDNTDYNNLNLNNKHYNLLNDQDDPDYATIEEIFPKQEQQNIQQKLPQPHNESIYVSAEEVRQLKKQQKAAANLKLQETQVNETRPKPQIAPKPSKEVIERALSKAGTSTHQKKVAPPVPPRGEYSFEKVEELRNKFGVNRDGSQPAGSVKGIAQMFEAKDQKKEASVQNIIKQMQIKEEVKSARDNIQILTKRLDTSGPNKLNISQELKEKLEKVIITPPSSPTSSKKPSAIQNEAPKVQETKHSIFYGTVNNGVPTPPPMPTESDLKKVKPTSGKERDMASQVNPKKRTVTEGKATERKNVNLMEALNKSHLFRERKAGIEENKPQTKFANPNIEHVKNAPVIGG